MLIPGRFAAAQEENPPGPIYIVEEGDTLWEIAQRFGVPLDNLAGYNGILNPGQLSVGTELVIPGMEEVQGILVTETIPYGENLRSLSRRYHLPPGRLARLNRLTSPNELYSGSDLILPDSNVVVLPTRRVSLSPSQSLLELAVLQNANPWRLVLSNDLVGMAEVLPADVLRLPDDAAMDGPGGFPGEIRTVEVSPSPLRQGGTTVIRLESDSEIDLRGRLIDHELHFFKDLDEGFVALQGIHALTRPGFYPLTVSGEIKNGTSLGFSQMVYIQDGGYSFETLTVPPETIDPDITKPEDSLWNSLPVEYTSQRMWEGIFEVPVVSATSDVCFSSYFGNRRSYNGSPYNYFHTGLDFCYNYNNEKNEIHAPAPGMVVYSGELTVRGKATMIDHGWGVYTAYMHQSETLVEVGEKVETGQVIGVVGKTGRVSGPHLHLEIWVGGVQVDPLDWFEKAIP